MNIFILDTNPRIAAKYHNNKHVVKMILESAQMLCTAVNFMSGEQITPYKSTHLSHPCSVWARRTLGNWLWLHELMLELNEEYKLRFNHEEDHLAVIKLRESNIVDKAKSVLCNENMTKFVTAMPDYCKSPNDDVVESYRNYYMKEKKDLANWKTAIPYWYK